MQTEIDTSETSLLIQILGVNRVGLESGNEQMYSQNTLPWLQSTSDNDVWDLWGVVFRDVIVLGPNNEYLWVFNLTENDLSDSDHYTTLKNQLLGAANPESAEPS